MQTGTIFSGIGHAGLILWVLVGDWLFPARPAQEVIVTSVSMMTTDEFNALQASATATPSEEEAPVRPQPRPEEVVEEPPPPEELPAEEPPPEDPPPPVEEPPPEVVEVVPDEPPPSDVPQAETEQVLPSESVEIQPVPEAEEIIAPDPVQPETEAETSDTPEPAVAEDPAATEVVPEEPTEPTVAEDTGDVTQTEANELQEAETGMTTSPRPRSRPEEAAPEPEVATEEPVETPPAESAELNVQPVDDAETDAAIDALLGEAVDEPVEEPVETGGQDLPQGPPLSGSEVSNLTSAIGNRWNLVASSTDALRTKIVVRVTFAQDSRPMDFELIESDGPSQAAIDNILKTAKRAVNLAFQNGELLLPPDKYSSWRVLELEFDATGMSLR